MQKRLMLRREQCQKGVLKDNYNYEGSLPIYLQQKSNPFSEAGIITNIVITYMELLVRQNINTKNIKYHFKYTGNLTISLEETVFSIFFSQIQICRHLDTTSLPK